MWDPPAAAFRLPRFGAAIASGAVACAIWAQPALAQEVPEEPVRLNGTIMQSTTADVQVDCSGGPLTASFTFSAEGVATAPYAGPFSESGVFEGPGGLDVDFDIDSLIGQLDGRKLPPFSAPGPVVVCSPFGGVATLTVVAAYEVFIVSPVFGTYFDSGTTTIEIVDGGPLGQDSVRQTFLSQFSEGPIGPLDPPVDQPVLLFIDEDSIDNGLPPNFFSATAVNDHIAKIGLRTPLPAFDGNNVGREYTLYTGQVGDEGWFAPRFDDPRWAAAGPTPDGKRNFVGHPRAAYPHGVGPGLGSPDANGDRESRLDKVRDVVPLRATGLEGLVGRRVCAVVWDSDIGINYDPVTATLKGANLGTVAFRVDSTTPRRNGSSGSLPAAEVQVLDAGTTCEEELENYRDAPVPRSSSEPYDTGR
jgi:hypothetical protein